MTPEDVARVAKQYLKPDNRTIGRYFPAAQPDRSVIPPSPDIVSELKDYKGKAAIEEGEAFDPSPANIEVAHHAHHAAQRPEAGSAAEEDPRRHGGREPATCISATRRA